MEKGIQGFITGYKKHNNTVTNPSYNYLVHEMKYWQAGFVFTNFTLTQFGDDYNITTTRLHHPNCHEECPNQCTNDWRYNANIRNYWVVDKSIDVSCGRTFII